MIRNSLPGIASIFLESEAEQSDLLVGDGIKQRLDNSVGEAPFLVLVDIDNLSTTKIDILHIYRTLSSKRSPCINGT